MNKTQITFSNIDNFFIQESYNILRSNIQFCGADIKTITITSCMENEGKTTICLNLGKVFAELGKKVLIVDADMRKSVMMSRYSDIANAKGLSEVLSGLAKTDDCICETQYDGLSILFAGHIPPNPVDLLSSKEFSELITWARAHYDYVFIDTAPLGIVIDAAVISPLTDGATIILSEKVHFGMVKKVVEQLKKSNSKIIGVIRNNVGKHKGDKNC